MLRILIADDHAIVRQGLKQIVTETRDMSVAGEASNGQELLNKIKEGEYDVVVLDITMPVRNGMDVLRQLRSEKPRLRGHFRRQQQRHSTSRAQLRGVGYAHSRGRDFHRDHV